MKPIPPGQPQDWLICFVFSESLSVHILNSDFLTMPTVASYMLACDRPPSRLQGVSVTVSSKFTRMLKRHHECQQLMICIVISEVRSMYAIPVLISDTFLSLQGRVTSAWENKHMNAVPVQAIPSLKAFF